MNLYDLNQMYTEALEGAIDENGEIKSDVLTELLGEIAEARETKVLNIVAFIKNLEYEASTFQGNIDYLEKELENRKKDQAVYTNKAKALKEYLNKNLEPGTKYKDTRGSLHWTTSHPLEVTIEPEMLAKIRLDLCRIEPNKTAIKEAIDGGDLIVGCKILDKKSVVIK